MQRLGEFFAGLTRRVLPDPMVIACGLTLLAAGLAFVWPQSDELAKSSLCFRALGICRIWFEGVWNKGFLVFALQMCMVLLTGYGLAKAPPATRFLGFLAGRVNSNRSAVVLVAAVSCIGCWINWGFGLIASGVLAGRVRESLESRGRKCRYALIVAAAYAGMMIWHGGLSGSAPLRVANEGVKIATGGSSATVYDELPPIPITRTTLSPANLGLTLVMIIGVPLLFAAMAGGGGGEQHTNDEEPAAPDGPAANVSSLPAACHTPPFVPQDGRYEESIADRINRSRVIPLLIALGFVVVVVDQLLTSGAAAIGLNLVNTVFLTLGLILHRNLSEYVAAVAEGGRAVTGIVLQFPLYSGIQGIMFGAGLAAAMSQWFVGAAVSSAEWLHVSPGHTFPVATFLSAGLVNFFVPSGGGQWIVQGPIMCGAAVTLGAPIEQTVMAVSYGDQWTNMIQPFWAIPLMGLTGVNVRRFMGYCTLLMLIATPVFVLALLAF